ncbi:tyrosine-type recombinase/integrase [Methylobacterium nigriterrae]|uniref:tyrosine-type recombinase/integrase n=1 Tax=Methylobacterium nigriterrae TaxID=3127512 RepID=UPI003013DC51
MSPQHGSPSRKSHKQLESPLTTFHFHDLRHEAVSRFFELGLTVPEVALISGHRDPRMFFRYTHPRAHIIAAKLAGLETAYYRQP